MHHMKIMFFLPLLNGGGAEKMVLKIANGFSKKYKCKLNSIKQGRSIFKGFIKKVKLTSLNSSSLYKSIPNLIIHMLKSKPDILITAMTHVNVVSLIVKKILFFYI